MRQKIMQSQLMP